jgi:hypothetical protein
VIDPVRILTHWGLPLAAQTWRVVSGGYSGAVVINVADQFALKGWPVHSTLDTIAAVHRIQIELARRTPLVPGLIAVPGGITKTAIPTVQFESGRLWELAVWRTGEPLSIPAGEASIRAAMQALASVHALLAVRSTRSSTIPGITRRLTAIDALITSPPLAIRHLLPNLSQVQMALQMWPSDSMLLHDCLCDCHREHVLFEGGRVTGIIDLAAAKLDHAAVDVARYLAEYPEHMGQGVASYRAAGGNPEVTLPRVELLARSGDLVALATHFTELKPVHLSPRGQERIDRLRRRVREVWGHI